MFGGLLCSRLPKLYANSCQTPENTLAILSRAVDTSRENENCSNFEPFPSLVLFAEFGQRESERYVDILKYMDMVSG